MSNPFSVVVQVFTAVSTAAALTAGKVSLGVAGTLWGAGEAFHAVRSIETGGNFQADDHRVKEILKIEGIAKSDAEKYMIFPRNEARMRKLVDEVGGVGWQTTNMIYAWHKNPDFVPHKSMRLMYKKNKDGNIELHVPAMNKAN